ncbi:MAG: hypothetical protein FWG80_02990 [Alphaproteobacteria bacterium]|nr:hypothetical protein [Alphaproteobacteria bacterium]
MFRFDPLVFAHWARLSNIVLHGIPGLAFGVLILGTLPIYFAVLSFIIKNKKTPVPLPFCNEEKKKKEEKPTTPETDTEPDIILPPDMPPEMKGPYSRAMRNKAFAQPQSAYELKLDPRKDDTIPSHSTESFPNPSRDDIVSKSSFPIPDFDNVPELESDTPVFREITFGGNDNDSQYEQKTTNPIDDKTAEKLQSMGYDTKTDDDIIIARNDSSVFAIAVHSDPDFWIADNLPISDDSDTAVWFASGKQKPSPITAVLGTAKKHGATPVLYLAEKNIMDLDDRQNKWQTAGVRVIDDLAGL